jgi:hypothetical protein
MAGLLQKRHFALLPQQEEIADQHLISEVLLKKTYSDQCPKQSFHLHSVRPTSHLRLSSSNSLKF